MPCDQKKVTNALLQLFHAFQSQLAHHTSSALGRRGLGSARETTSSWAPKRTVTLCPNQDWSWLESRPLRTSSPLTDRHRYWTRSSPERNDRGAESVATLRFVLWATVLSSCQPGTNICFLQRVPESPWECGNTGVIQNVCQWVRDALCGKRPGPRQQESTSQSWRQRAQNFCLQLETTGARSPGSRRMGGPSSWRGRGHSKSVRPPSTRRTRGIQGGKCPSRQIFRACSTSGGGSGLVQIVTSANSSR